MIRPIRTFTVSPSLPPELERQRALVYNLRWAWNHDAIELFRWDGDLREQSGHNPALMLGTIDQGTLQAAASGEGFLSHLNRVSNDFDAYQKSERKSPGHSLGGERLVAATHFRNNISKYSWRRRKMKKQFYQCVNKAVAIILLLGLALALNPGVTAQKQSRDGIQLRISYERGYRAGYADGYDAGENDFADRIGREYQRHTLYQEADRGYESRFGPRVDYKEGYSLGFEVGYFDGYVGRAFDLKIPPNVAHPGASVVPLKDQKDRERRKTQALVPGDVLLRIRLETRLTTETNCEGDRFTARVIEPSEYEGAVIQGHVAKVERSGRMTGRTEMALDFDAITLRNGRSGTFNAQIEKVFATESVKSVDGEGNIESASKTKETEIRSIGGAVLGAIIGGIAGGGKGAAIGAIIGAGAGAGSVYVQGDKDLILEPGAQMIVRVAYSMR